MILIPGKRKALADVLVKSGLFRVGVRARRLSGRQELTVFNFHRIRDVGGPATLFDDDVYGVDVEVLRRQMRWLRDHTTIIGEADLLAALRGERALPDSAVMVTFDDGYEDNHRLALPILSELNIPATFFIPTQAIDERALGWWDLIAYLIGKSDRAQIRVLGETVALGAAGGPGRVAGTCERRHRLGVPEKRDPPPSHFTIHAHSVHATGRPSAPRSGRMRASRRLKTSRPCSTMEATPIAT
jgi:peptidoglycan/xylan/chitin deacetylase (PgdA/CDA1 family)